MYETTEYLDEILNTSKNETTSVAEVDNGRVTLIVNNVHDFEPIIVKSLKRNFTQNKLSSFCNGTFKGNPLSGPIIITDIPVNTEMFQTMFSSFKATALSNEVPIIIIIEGWKLGKMARQVIEGVDYAYSFNGCKSIDKFNASFTTTYGIIKERR